MLLFLFSRVICKFAFLWGTCIVYVSYPWLHSKWYRKFLPACTHKIVRKVHSLLKTFTGPSELGSSGVVCPNQEFGKFVNLISIRENIMPTTLWNFSPRFSDLSSALHLMIPLLYIVTRAVGRTENPGMPVLFGGHNLPPG